MNTVYHNFWTVKRRSCKLVLLEGNRDKEGSHLTGDAPQHRMPNDSLGYKFHNSAPYNNIESRSLRHSRWLILEIGLATLLLAMLYTTFWTSADAASLGQTQPPAGEPMKLPVPPTSPFAKPVVPPTSSVSATEAVLIPTVTPTPPPDLSVTSSASTTVTGTLPVTSSESISGTPTYYVVLPGDTLFVIASDFGTTVEAVMAANELSNSDFLYVGQVLVIPGADGALPDPALLPVALSDGGLTESVIVPRGTITERMTSLAQQTSLNSPFYGTTWLTYYGRPNVPVMGILGEFSIEELVPLLRAEAEVYDRANGDGLTVMPAFHLVYGMATKAPGADNSYLGFMADSEVLAYIEAAKAEGWSVILDVQIGGLSPTEAISPALEYLAYPNVHLAIDPEFAMAHPGQVVPGNPIGFVTAEQVNEVQEAINNYMISMRLTTPRILLVHQFQSNMILDKEKLDASSYPNVALTLSVDGWGGPWGKISKYNSLVTVDSPFTAFKLFYRWDEPLLTPDEALGNHPISGSDAYMDVTPNFIIYQ
jgi:LysM repeat protein